MSGGGEYEPKDSRKFTGMKGKPGKNWREQEKDVHSAEYAPRDQRNVTGETDPESEHWSRDKDGETKERKPGEPD